MAFLPFSAVLVIFTVPTKRRTLARQLTRLGACPRTTIHNQTSCSTVISWATHSDTVAKNNPKMRMCGRMHARPPTRTHACARRCTRTHTQKQKNRTQKQKHKNRNTKTKTQNKNIPARACGHDLEQSQSVPSHQLLVYSVAVRWGRGFRAVLITNLQRGFGFFE